jgi:hypothetical protein
MQIVLNAILFCLILLLCFIFGATGFLIGFKKRPKPEPKNEPTPLTEEQERQIEKRKRQEENFWNYNGDNQE